MGISRLGDRALPTPLTTGGFCGGQAQVTHELSGVVKARQSPLLRDDGNGHGAWHTPQGVQGLNHRLKPPGVHWLVEFLCETLQTFSVLVHGPDIFLEDDVRHRGRTDHFREPAPVGWPPGGPAGIADIVPPQTRFEPARGGLEIPNGIFASPAQVADGFVFDLWNIDGSQVP